MSPQAKDREFFLFTLKLPFLACYIKHFNLSNKYHIIILKHQPEKRKISPWFMASQPEFTLSGHAKSLQSYLTFFDPMDCQAPLTRGFPRQEYLSGLPCPPPEDLLNPGIEPWKPGVKPGVISCNCCIAGRVFTTEPPGNPLLFSGSILIYR